MIKLPEGKQLQEAYQIAFDLLALVEEPTQLASALVEHSHECVNADPAQPSYTTLIGVYQFLQVAFEQHQSELETAFQAMGAEDRNRFTSLLEKTNQIRTSQKIGFDPQSIADHLKSAVVDDASITPDLKGVPLGSDPYCLDPSEADKDLIRLADQFIDTLKDSEDPTQVEIIALKIQQGVLVAQAKTFHDQLKAAKRVNVMTDENSPFSVTAVKTPVLYDKVQHDMLKSFAKRLSQKRLTAKLRANLTQLAEFLQPGEVITLIAHINAGSDSIAARNIAKLLQGELGEDLAGVTVLSTRKKIKKATA